MRELDWQPIKTAPKDATDIEVLMADGTVYERAHWACDLSGEEQPAYIGWFVPVMNADGTVNYMRGIKEPKAWRQIG